MILTTTNLSKNYGRIRAVDGLNLEIEQGNVYGILGPNGSGKTTTLGIILGILQQKSGSYEWFDGAHKNPLLRVGAILETPNFYPYLNAFDNLEIIRQIKNAPKTDFEELLRMVELYERGKSAFRTYSLGMKQRLAIAATLIGDPDVLIFDEPTNGLDPVGIAEVRSLLKRIASLNKTVIMASHMLDEVEKICSHVAILKKGKLLASGPVGQIINDNIVIEVNSENNQRLKEILGSLPQVDHIIEKENYLELQCDSQTSVAAINKTAFQAQIVLNHLVMRRTSLEEEFLTITNQTNQPHA